MKPFSRQDRVSNYALFINSDRKNISIPIEVINDVSSRPLGATEIRNKGIIYNFRNEGIIQFFMNNTKNPIDIVFASKTMDITHVERSIFVDGMGKGMLVTSKKKARYVFELPGGFTAKNNINIGDRITIIA